MQTVNVRCYRTYKAKGIFESIKIITKVEILRQGCEVHFLEIGNDLDHVHFLVQSVPMLSITKIVTIIKSITAREIFSKHPEVKKILWGGSLWSSGYYANTVGQFSNSEVIKQYIKNQGKDCEYKKLHQGQLNLEV